MGSGNPNSARDKLKLAIVNYGMGNLTSVQCALDRLGMPSTITSKPEDLDTADALILPGVGAFGKAMENLESHKLISALKKQTLDKKKPLLGICLGMQLLAESSSEMGSHKGLSFVKGTVERLNVASHHLPVPHVGWNNVFFTRPTIFSERLNLESHFYFDHSFHFVTSKDNVLMEVDYGDKVVAGVINDNIVGFQFHPEKSHVAGLKLLRNFLRFAEARTGAKPSC